jgi:hypothetical protein
MCKRLFFTGDTSGIPEEVSDVTKRVRSQGLCKSLISSSDTDVCILSIMMQIVLPLCDPADESLITSERL